MATKSNSNFFFLFRATPAAHGSSQARGQIDAAASLHHSHSKTGLILTSVTQGNSGSFNPLSKARDQTLDTSWLLNPLRHNGNSKSNSLFFFLTTLRHMEFLGQGSDPICSCDNAGFLIHRARLGIELVSQSSQEAGDPIGPQQELHDSHFLNVTHLQTHWCTCSWWKDCFKISTWNEIMMPGTYNWTNDLPIWVFYLAKTAFSWTLAI